MDPQLLIFHRQYLQLFEPDFLAWPPKQLLRDAGVQSWLYENMFNCEKNAKLPSERYQLRVLKPLLSKVERAIEDPEEDEISDSLMSHLSTLISSDLPSEGTAVQQKSYVTFTCLPPSHSDADFEGEEPIVTLLERRNLISGSLTTGFRTWEAALHLGSYLLSCPQIVKEKNLLELGAGTGFLSILAAKHLGAKHVTTTDGDEGVVEALKENLFLNGLDDENKVTPSILRWGHGLKGSWVQDECESWPYDVVLGADITYEKTAISALVSTLRSLFELRPQLLVLISGAVRNLETFETFRHACCAFTRTCLEYMYELLIAEAVRNKFSVQEIDFEPRPIRQQTSLFYAKAVPLKILSIVSP